MKPHIENRQTQSFLTQMQSDSESEPMAPTGTTALRGSVKNFSSPRLHRLKSLSSLFLLSFIRRLAPWISQSSKPITTFEQIQVAHANLQPPAISLFKFGLAQFTRLFGCRATEHRFNHRDKWAINQVFG